MAQSSVEEHLKEEGSPGLFVVAVARTQVVSPQGPRRWFDHLGC